MISTTRCRYHGADACCNACTNRKTTDGIGFPHPSEWQGRKPVRVCPLCSAYVGREAWVNDIPHAVFCCASCAPGAYERRLTELRRQVKVVPEPQRRNVQRVIDELERRARVAVTG